MSRSSAPAAGESPGRPADAIVLLLAGLAYFVTLKLLSFHEFGVHGEAANFEYMLWSVLQGGSLKPAAEAAHFFSQHFSPVLYALVPLYALFRTPLVLLIVQACAAAVAVVPLYWLAHDSLRHRWAALAIGAAYLLQRHLNYGLMYDFHMEIFYPLFYFCAFLCIARRRWVLFYLCLLLTVTVKEDANVANAGLGLFLIAQREYRHGVATFAGSLLILLVTFGLVFPHFRRDLADAQYQFVHYWSGYGESLSEIARGMLDPRTHAEVIFTGRKLSKMTTLFANFAFLPLGTWSGALFLVGPSWFMLYASSKSLLHGPLIYYGLLIVPFLFFASIHTLRRLQARGWFSAQRVALVGASVLLLVCLGNSRIFRQLRPGTWQRDARYATAEALIAEVPPGAAVSAQVDLQIRFPIRPIRDCLPRGVGRAEFLLFDLQGNPYPLTAEENRALADSLRRAEDWNVAAERAGFLLLRRTR